MVNIFDYFDYRKYLRDIYKDIHSRDPKFSYRFIRDKTGIDPGFLVKIFNGQKNLPESAIPKIIKLLKLEKIQGDYFTHLVSYGRAKTDIQKKIYFEKLISFKGPNCQKVGTDSQAFYSKWYYTAIRELIGVYSFSGDYDQLASLLVPSVKVSEVKKGVELLEKLGFIEKDENGRYRQTNKFITSGDEGQGSVVRVFQRDTIQLASNALEQIPKELRDISTITTALSPKGFTKLRDKISEFRNEVLRIAHNEENATAVYHINFQLFPISKTWQDNLN